MIYIVQSVTTTQECAQVRDGHLEGTGGNHHEVVEPVEKVSTVSVQFKYCIVLKKSLHERCGHSCDVFMLFVEPRKR